MKAALIGAGQIARQHLACLQELEGVQIGAVCDLSPATAECAAERFRIPRWYTDHREMLAAERPDVVHVTTPPSSHFRLATDALQAGAHVFVEKPATENIEETRAIARTANATGRALVENHNYLFNQATREILAQIDSGAAGRVLHVEALICLDILGPTGFADPNLPHPALRMAGGAIADFLPHLASLAWRFVGPHRAAHAVWSKRAQSPLPYDELHAVVDAERGSASLGFIAAAQPDAFWLRVYCERMQATTNLFETRLTFDRVLGGAKTLQPLRNGLREARDIRRASFGSLWRKLSGGPGPYDGLWELVRSTYAALEKGGELPVGLRQVEEVGELVAALKPQESRQ
jgi:predicted dehydrogenase